MHRHAGTVWSDVRERLDACRKKLFSLYMRWSAQVETLRDGESKEKGLYAFGI
jgi:hypothetical protein